jgi:hypothetical protein
MSCILLSLSLQTMYSTNCGETQEYSRARSYTLYVKSSNISYIFIIFLRFPEIAVLVHFVILALLWLFRDPKFIDGWSILFTEG